MAIEDVKQEEVPDSIRQPLEDAKAKHEDVYMLKDPDAGVTVICKRPSRAIYRKLREDQNGPPERSAHRFEALLNGCLVFPSPKEFDVLLNTMPWLGDAFGVKLVDTLMGESAIDMKRAG